MLDIPYEPFMRFIAISERRYCDILITPAKKLISPYILPKICGLNILLQKSPDKEYTNGLSSTNIQIAKN